MAQNFIGCDRGRELLLPPSLREWLPDDHLAWFVIDAVAEMELAEFYGAYRHDGHGRAAHGPVMMVALLLYAYATGRRSSRQLERACVDDVAVRVIPANQRPDHCTIARFRQRHENALAGLFGDVLALCADAGLVGVAVLAVDGTKVHANASQHENLDYERIAREILAEADQVDEAEDSGSATGAATSCRPSCRRRRDAAAGCARPSAASTSSAPPKRDQSRSRVLSGFGRRSVALTRTTRCTARRTRTTRPLLGSGSQIAGTRSRHDSSASTLASMRSVLQASGASP